MDLWSEKKSTRHRILTHRIGDLFSDMKIYESFSPNAVAPFTLPVMMFMIMAVDPITFKIIPRQKETT